MPVQTIPKWLEIIDQPRADRQRGKSDMGNGAGPQVMTKEGIGQ